MIAADTVEERILELQARKAELAAIAFSEEAENQDSSALSALDNNDIDFLFGASRESERQAA
jgi:SNF2 family DNA or RNA helicase